MAFASLLSGLIWTAMIVSSISDLEPSPSYSTAITLTSVQADGEPSHQHATGRAPETIVSTRKTIGSSPFVASNEWQPIEDGQQVPGGLHYRLNLATGLKEAKLLSHSDKSIENAVLVSLDESNRERSGKIGTPRKTGTGTSGEPRPFSIEQSEQLQENRRGENDKYNDVFNLDESDYLRGSGLENTQGTPEGSSSESRPFLREELENALKDIDKMDRTSYSAAESENDTARVAKEFRSYAELKETFAAMNAQIRTDREIIKDLVASLTKKELHRFNVEESSDRLAELQEVEYLVHQIDNARDFVDIGGLDIVKDLTSSLSDGGSPHEIPLISEAIRILGSSSQSNAKVQVRVLKEGFLPLLLKQIQWQYQCHVAQSPQFSLGIFSRLFYAISALVRHFPKAQKDFIEAEGLVVLTDVMKDASVAPKMHFKILTLVNDLLTERHDTVLQNSSSSELLQERIRQYAATPLEPLLKQNGWCETLIELTVRLGNPETSVDAAEILRGIQLMHGECSEDFRRNIHRLDMLESHFRSRAAAEDEQESDGYFRGLAESCTKTVDFLRRGTGKWFESKDEL